MFHKGEIPFVRLIVPLIAGIFSASVFSNALLLIAAGHLAFASFFLLVVLIIAYKKFSLYQVKWLVGFVAHSFIFALGYHLAVYKSEKFDPTHYSLQKADAFLAGICSEPKISGTTLRFEARVRRSYRQHQIKTATGKIMISIHTDTAKEDCLKYGDLVLIPGLYNEVDPPYNPGEFNYKSYLADHQIYYQVFLRPEQVMRVIGNRGNPVISFALKLRKKLVDKFYQYLPDKDAAAFASTLILGYRADLSRGLIEAYSKTGTMHVLSVSGMHVGIVFMVLSVILKFMDRTQTTRLIRAFLIISVIWLYALLTGFSAAACRAAFMLSFIVMGKALNKHQNTYNLIAISAFFLLLYYPFYLVDAGFQLSYLAVMGLVYFHPKIYQTVYIKNRLLGYIWSYSALSIAAQLATFPFSMYYFHQFPTYFLFSNLFLVFPMAIIMYSGILLLFIPFPEFLINAGRILNGLINFTNSILYYIENLPYSSWDGIWINTVECVLICIIIIALCVVISYRTRKLTLLIAVLMVILCSSFSWNWISNQNQHKIIFYNLRKNTGLAYLHNGQSVIITDVDRSDKVMDFSILPTVKKNGSRKEEFYSLNQSFSGNTFLGDQDFYQLGSYRILRWTKRFDDVKFSKPLTVDALIVSGNPRISIKQIASFLNFGVIVIDANNPDYKIERWVLEAKEMNVPFYVLKKNPALAINL